MINRTWWASVRRNSEGEFILAEECSASQEVAVGLARAADCKLAAWARANPVVRVVQVQVREV